MSAPLEDDVKGYECKHALYFPANDGSMNDILVVKEYKHFKDGRREPYLRKFINHKRDFYVTRENFRDHKEKKEWEDISRLQRFECTQIEMPFSVGRALQRTPSKDGMRFFSSSPYLYGCDADTPLLIKHRYMKKYPDCTSDNLIAVLDIETDMVVGHSEPTIISLTMGSRAKMVVVKSFMDGIFDPERKINEAIEKYLGDPNSELGDIIRARKLEVEIDWADNPAEAAVKIIQSAHLWQPDILAIWNKDFDIPRINAMLEKYGYDLADVWSDPSIPKPFRSFKYIQGKSVKKTASGKQISLSPAERWHVSEFPASFYILDAMCVYLKLRIANGKQPSYKLDDILNLHLGIRKLKFKEADQLHGAAWQMFMQRNHRVEYCVYNLFDCISMEMLDENITDLRRVAGIMCGHSPWARFPSQPKRIVDDMYFFCLANQKVAATCSRDMTAEIDKHVVGLENWIITLSSYMLHEDGMQALIELPNVRTNIRGHVGDLDVEGTYPTEETLFNISKETTAQELSQIQGVSDQTRRAIGVNLSGGYVNAVEIVIKAYGAPSPDTLLQDFQLHLAHQANAELNGILTKTCRFNRTTHALKGSFSEEVLMKERLDTDDELEEAGAEEVVDEHDYELED